MEDYYKVLGVDENATDNQIKKAFRTASLLCHPDRPGGSKEKFQKINEAFQILGDRNKREKYNMQRRNPFAQQGMGNINIPPDIFKIFFGNSANGIPGMGEGNGVPFGFPGSHVRIFQNGKPVNMSRVMKPSPIVKGVEITIEHAYSGITIPINIERWIQHNNERKMEKECLYVKIPMGIDSNEIILLEGKGNIQHEIKGDVKIHITVRNNSKFTREGMDLIMKKKLTLKEALIGFSFDITHISGKKYTINNNNGMVITNNYTKVIAHMGMRREQPHPASPIAGNLKIVFEVEFPTSLTSKQREELDKIL